MVVSSFNCQNIPLTYIIDSYLQNTFQNYNIMNIFNKPIRSQQQDDLTFINLGQLQIRKGWLHNNPQYHTLVLTSIHLAQLLTNIQYLQGDTTQRNLFKMAQINRQVSQIIQGKKLIKLTQSIQNTASPQRKFICQKVSGIFNTIYIRECRIENYKLYIGSKKKGEDIVVDLSQYSYHLEFKTEYDKGLDKAKDKEVNEVEIVKGQKAKAAEEKKHFKWVEVYPVRVYFSGQNLKPYAIYIEKVSDAKELLDYFQMRKSTSNFTRYKGTLDKYANYFKRNVVAAFAGKIQDCANAKFRKMRAILDEQINLKAQQTQYQQQQQQQIQPQQIQLQDVISNLAVGKRSQLDSPIKRIQKGKSMKVKITKHETHQIHQQDARISHNQPFSALVRRRQITLVGSPILRGYSPDQSERKYTYQQQQMSPLYLTPPLIINEDGFNKSELFRRRKSNMHLINLQQVGEYTEEMEMGTTSQLFKIKSAYKGEDIDLEVEEKQAKETKLDALLSFCEINMYVKHFQRIVNAELIQYRKSDFQYSTQSQLKFPIVKYDIVLIQDTKNQNKMILKQHTHFKIASSSTYFGLILKFGTGNYQVPIQLETQVKYQKYYCRIVHIQKIPFAGRMQFSVCKNQLLKCKDLNTAEVLREFLVKGDYESKYLYIDRGKARAEADGIFRQKVWAKVLEQNNQIMLEKQVFLGVPTKLRDKFYRLLSQGSSIPTLQSLCKLTFHQIRLVKQSLPNNLLDQLKTYIIIQDLLDKLLQFEFNQYFRQRLLGILLFVKFKYGLIQNTLFIIMYEIFRKLTPVLLEFGKNKEIIYKIIGLYGQLQYELDEFFSDIYNYY